MDPDTILCKLLKLHTYNSLLDNNKYDIGKCEICGAYIVTHKAYKTISRYKHDSLPNKIKIELKQRSLI